MKITRTLCDRTSCKNENAEPFYLFKERKADGAGGMEDWNFMFDLCPHCTKVLLAAVLNHYSQFITDLNVGTLLAFLTKLGIKTREN